MNTLEEKRISLIKDHGFVYDNDPRKIEDPNKSINDIIFAPDPVTGHPISDLAVAFDPKVPVEVRNFILTNYQRPLQSVTGVRPDGLNEDEANNLVLQMAPSRGEDIQSYSDRLLRFIENDDKFRKTIAKLSSADPNKDATK